MTHLDKVFRETEQKMNKTIEATSREFLQVRTGRASTGLVEGIMVDYYNTPTPLKQLAAISTPDPRLIIIQPWDTSAVQNIEKAILKSNLGVSPVVEGKIIRLPLPQLTKERREELVKLIKKMAEDGKVSLRTARRDANESIKALQKEGKITEDDEKHGYDKIQELTGGFTTKIEKLLKEKEKEIVEF